MSDSYITEAEKLVLKHLADAWNEFIRVPISTQEGVDFQRCINDAIKCVTLRIASRVTPEINILR
jgi:hypothetical protein